MSDFYQNALNEGGFYALGRFWMGNGFWYAKGEITKKEFERMKEDLMK